MVIKDFYPSWFVVCMGTGILASLFKAIEMEKLSILFTLFNILFFAIIFTIWLLRWFLAPESVIKDIKNPLFSNYFATMPISLLILGLNVVINRDYFGTTFSDNFALLAYAVGLLLMLVFSITTFIVHLMHEEINAPFLNFAYFMPPVGNIIISILGNEIVGRISLSKETSSQLIFLNSSMFGLGFMLFLAYLPIIKGRFLLQKPIEQAHFPTMFILLAPVGASIVALKGLSLDLKEANLIKDISIFNIVNYFLWGFGTWLFIALIVLLILYIPKKIRFNLSYWAFVFPVGIFTLATLKINASLKIPLLEICSKIIVFALVLLWLYNIFMTLKNIFNKRLLIRQ